MCVISYGLMVKKYIYKLNQLYGLVDLWLVFKSNVIFLNKLLITFKKNQFFKRFVGYIRSSANLVLVHKTSK